MVRADTGRGRARSHARFPVLRRQLPFAVVVLIAVVASVVWSPRIFTDAELVIAFVLALGATILAAAVPWGRLPSWCAMAVPLLNMAAIAFAELGGFPAGPLLLLPVLVLATAGRLGVVLAIVGGWSASWVPVILTHDSLLLSTAMIPELVLRPTVLVAASITLFVSERRSAARSSLLAGQSSLVEELLTDTRADRQLTEAVLDTIRTSVIVFDRDGVVQRVNRAAAQAYGDRIRPGMRAGTIGGRVFAADGTTPVPPDRTPIVRGAAGEVIQEEVVWAERKDGTRLAYRVSAQPLVGESGPNAGAVLALENLTRELRALAEREEFVSAVSHELRTPLTSVGGYLDLAIDDPEVGERPRRHLEIAARNAHRLEILIENLLAAARGGAGAATAPVDLSAVVRDVVEDQAPRARDAEITVAVRAPEACVVLGDPARLTQVVDNLVSNAIKYSIPASEVTVSVDPEHDGADSGGTVLLRVRDRGIGISAEELPRVFDRFYRARSARESTVQGTGLGLPITRQIVEDLGGSIALASGADGTCVDVVLPGGGS